MFAELERARLTKMLCEMKEAAGNIEEAAEILQDVTVETVGAMDIKEKSQFLLEQMRLCLKRRDYIRTDIISGKVDRKTLAQPGFEAEKLKFSRLQRRLKLHERDFLAICQVRSICFLSTTCDHYRLAISSYLPLSSV